MGKADESVAFDGLDKKETFAKRSSLREANIASLSPIGQKISGTVEEIHERAELFQFRKQPQIASLLAKNVEGSN